MARQGFRPNTKRCRKGENENRRSPIRSGKAATASQQTLGFGTVGCDRRSGGCVRSSSSRGDARHIAQAGYRRCDSGGASSRAMSFRYERVAQRKQTARAMPGRGGCSRRDVSTPRARGPGTAGRENSSRAEGWRGVEEFEVSPDLDHAAGVLDRLRRLCHQPVTKRGSWLHRTAATIVRGQRVRHRSSYGSGVETSMPGRKARRGR